MKEKDQIEIAYDFIKSRILSNEYKPAQKLIESQLSSQIGVSRNTVKLALLRLEKERLVEIEKNRGAIVKAFTLEEVLNYLEIRIYLECLIIKSAVLNINDAQLKKMEEIINQMEDCIENNRLDDYSNFNSKFHDIIYQASTNPQAVELVTTIKTQLSRYNLRTILIPGRNVNSFKEHHAIFTALKNREVDKAVEAIKLHISNVRKTIQDFYQYLV